MAWIIGGSNQYLIRKTIFEVDDFVVSWDKHYNPGSNVLGANMGPTWVLSAPDGPHVGPMNLAIGECIVLPGIVPFAFLRLGAARALSWGDDRTNVPSPQPRHVGHGGRQQAPRHHRHRPPGRLSGGHGAGVTCEELAIGIDVVDPSLRVRLAMVSGLETRGITWWGTPLTTLTPLYLYGQPPLRSLWCHQMETFSASLSLWTGKSVDSPHKETVTRTFYVSLLSVQTKCWTNTWLTGSSRRHDGHLTSP